MPRRAPPGLTTPCRACATTRRRCSTAAAPGRRRRRAGDAAPRRALRGRVQHRLLPPASTRFSARKRRCAGIARRSAATRARSSGRSTPARSSSDRRARRRSTSCARSYAGNGGAQTWAGKRPDEQPLGLARGHRRVAAAIRRARLSPRRGRLPVAVRRGNDGAHGRGSQTASGASGGRRSLTAAAPVDNSA